jgi:C1A family cysteine protease
VHKILGDKGLGWLPDFPDIRDYGIKSKPVSPLFQEVGISDPKDTSKTETSLPVECDLRKWCSPIENQDLLGSCTAHAGIGLVEYFERKASGKHIDGSRLFLYKVTRNLLHFETDTGAFLRTTMGALTMFGVPPEEYWPYDILNYDIEPPAFCYSFARNFQSIKYVRLDKTNIPKNELLLLIKDCLSHEFPVMFGFTVYSSIIKSKDDGIISFPTTREDYAIGGHAVMAVGYDDTITMMDNSDPPTPLFKGAFLIRNSWGIEWGNKGYGWLPYEYLLRGITSDWWTIINQAWVDTGQFGQ